MRYSVDTGAVQDGADAVEAALHGLERVAVARALGPVAAALPGSRVADEVGRLGQAWECRMADTRWMLKGLGARLLAAAESYVEAERVAQQAVAGRTRAGGR